MIGRHKNGAWRAGCEGVELKLPIAEWMSNHETDQNQRNQNEKKKFRNKQVAVSDLFCPAGVMTRVTCQLLIIMLLYHTFSILAGGAGMGATRMRLGAPRSRLKLRIASGMHIETTEPRTKSEALQPTDIGIVPFRPARFTTSVTYSWSAITGPYLGESYIDHCRCSLLRRLAPHTASDLFA